MKKIVITSVIFMICFSLAGCGNKDLLTCSLDLSDDGIQGKQKMMITFKDNTVSTLQMQVDVKITDDVSDEDWEDYVSNIDNTYPDTDAVGVQLTKENDPEKQTYLLTLDIDVNKANNEDVAKYGLDLDNVVGNYSTVKEQVEKSGFTCE